MALIMQRFGGPFVSDAASARRVAQRIVDMKNAGNGIVVVVSAMGGTTDELIDFVSEIAPGAPAREMDILLTAGERISMALLLMAVNSLGAGAHAFTGWQAGLCIDAHYDKAPIAGVVPERIARTVESGIVAVVVGFQGVNDRNDVTTPGRGGPDTTVIALAAALCAGVCEIYTDVDDVFSADPQTAPVARQLPYMTHKETPELAAHGAKVLHL